MKKAPKDKILKARVPSQMKLAVLAYAEAAGEVEAVVVREAVAEYFAKRKIEIGKLSLADQAALTDLISGHKIPRIPLGKKKRK